MPITFDQVSLGSNAIDSAATTIALTTTATVAPGALIVICATNGDGSFLLSSASSSPSLSWSVDSSGNASGAGVGFASAPAPAGLASGSTITATFSGSTVGRGICAFSLLGTNLTPLDVTSGPNGFSATPNWTGASTTIKAGSILITGAHCVITNETSTPTSPSIELFDFGAGAGTFDMTVCYRIEPVAGAYTIAGHWDGAPNETGNVQSVAYKAAPSSGVSGAGPVMMLSRMRKFYMPQLAFMPFPGNPPVVVASTEEHTLMLTDMGS